MGILATDVIVMSQVTSFLSNDFGIHDLGGQPVGRIVTEGSTGSRLFMGTRQPAIVDADGSLLLRVDDVVNLIETSIGGPGGLLWHREVALLDSEGARV